jgi:hypothetical protein
LNILAEFIILSFNPFFVLAELFEGLDHLSHLLFAEVYRFTNLVIFILKLIDAFLGRVHLLDQVLVLSPEILLLLLGLLTRLSKDSNLVLDL